MNTNEIDFISAFNFFQREVHNNAIEKGFYDNERNKGELIALIHSEISEALEALRNGNKPDEHVPEFSGAEIELADAVIRIMDMAQYCNFNLSEAIIKKMQYNRTRPFKHGKKF